MMAASVAGAADVLHGFIGSLSSQLRGMFESSRDRTAGQELMAFVAAVRWQEPWIVGLFSTHALLLILVVLTLRRETFQAVLFIAFAALIWSGERVNTLLGRNWQRFSQQNYFDAKGLFFSTLVSGPLILLEIGILVNLLVRTAKLMMKAKRAELRAKAKASSQQETGGADGRSGPASRTRAARSKKTK